MGLFIGAKLPLFKLGYPTVSDKYNVDPGILSTSVAEGVPYGTVLAYGEASGKFIVWDGADVKKVVGPMCAVNVKLADPWTNEVKVMPGEACSPLRDGYIALAIDPATDLTAIVEGTPVTATVAEGKVVLGLGGTVIPGWYFTGLTEVKAMKLDEAGKKKVPSEVLAEVEIVRHGA